MSERTPEEEKLAPKEVLRLYGFRPHSANALIARIEADALRKASNELTKKNTRAGLGWPTRDSIQLWDMAEQIESEATGG